MAPINTVSGPSCDDEARVCSEREYGKSLLGHKKNETRTRSDGIALIKYLDYIQNVIDPSSVIGLLSFWCLFLYLHVFFTSTVEFSRNYIFYFYLYFYPLSCLNLKFCMRAKGVDSSITGRKIEYVLQIL